MTRIQISQKKAGEKKYVGKKSVTYPDTSSFGISPAKASAISLDPMFAMHWSAKLTWTGFREERSFLMLWLIRLIKSLFWLIRTEMNK